MVGHNFGLLAAVYNYYRRAAIINDWLLAMGPGATHYYDDKFGFSRNEIVEDDLHLVGLLHTSLGIAFSGEKTQAGRTVTVLGIEYRFQLDQLAITEQRRQELVAELSSLADPSALTAGAAAKLKGKLQFVASHSRGRYGRSFLKAFSDRQYGSKGAVSDAALRHAIEFWPLLLTQGAPLAA